MGQLDPRLEDIFAQALNIAGANERAAFVERACGGDETLRREVETLLQADQGAGDFMKATQIVDQSDAVPIEKAGDRIGRFKLLEVIGEGGFGVVWMAEQEEPVRRRVALKIIKLGMDTRQVIARFEAERQALAMMDHPSIARVFDGGATDTGRPYFVMELVRGIRLTDYCDANKLSTRARLELFIQVCQAVQHAHQKGIIHRDLKPSNILVTEQDGAPVPKVIDFGVAKATQTRLTERTLFTGLHQMIGTPAYMSPEQAGLGKLDVDTRSDIYALGVLLYELLTGRTPFSKEELEKAGLDEILRLIREQDPPKPSTRLTQELAAAGHVAAGVSPAVEGGILPPGWASKSPTPPDKARPIPPGGTPGSTAGEDARRHRIKELIPHVRGDLDWIVMKALEKNRNRRYQSATAFAEDVQRHLNEEPVTAAAAGALYRVGKFARRHRVGLTMAATIIVLLVAATVVSLRLAVVADIERGKAEQARKGESVQRQAAEKSAAEKREQLVRLDVANGVRALENLDGFGALLWFIEALRQDTPGTRAEEMHRRRIGAILDYSPRLMQIWFHEAAIHRAAFSPDGRWALTAGRDRTARLWDTLTGEPGAVLRHDTSVSEAAFSANGRRVLTLTEDGAVRVWEAATGQLAGPPLEHGYRVTHALFSVDGRRVFTAGDPTETNLTEMVQVRRLDEEKQGEVRIWDAATGRQVRPPFRRKREGNQQLALSPDGQWLAASFAGVTMVWNLRQPRAIQILGGSEAKATFLPGLTTDQADAEMETLLPAVPLLRRARGREESLWVAGLAFSPENDRLMIAWGDGSAHVWPLRSSQPVVLQQPRTRGAPPPRSVARQASFSSDGQRVLLVDDDGIVRLWNARTGEAEGQLKGKAGNQAWFSPDGRFAFLSAQVWDIESDEAISPQPLHPYLNAAAFSPDGAKLLTAGADGNARLWSLVGGLAPQPPLQHDWPTVAAQLGESAQPASGSSQQILAAWPQFSHVRHAAFSPDSRRVLTASWNGSARVWDATSGEAITPYVILDGLIEFASFNHDGTRFVTVGGKPPEVERGAARVWDARTGQPLTPILRHPQWLENAVFSPDGRWLVTHSRGGAQIWNATTGAPAEWPINSNSAIRCVSFSPDGSLIAACGVVLGYQTRLWNAQTGQPATPPLDDTNEMTRLEFSPDGRWLVTLTEAATGHAVMARIWDVASGRPVTPPLRRVGFSPKVMFTSDGRRLFILVGPELIALELQDGQALGLTEWRGLKMHPLAITTDGQRFATRDNGKLRVYDALTGEPLTPPLPDEGDSSAAGVIFSPDGRLLLAVNGERARLWPLSREARPVEELLKLGQLLSGRRIDVSGNFVEWSSVVASGVWQSLRLKYPASFMIAPEQVRKWRERMVDSSEKEERWTTAAFHLEQLVKAYPTEEALRLRRARARNHAAMEELR